MSKESPEQIRGTLDGFTGTTKWFRHPLSQNHLYTEGVQYLAESCGAYWLLDLIVSYQKKCLREEMLRDHQFWTVKVDLAKHKCVVTCEKDIGLVFLTKKIGYTDFPLEEVKIWVERMDEDKWCILLPTEH